MKIIDYKVVHCDEVIGLMNEGYQLYGFICVDADGWKYQAMVKYEEIPTLEMSSFDSNKITNCLIAGINDGSVKLPYPCNEMCMSHAPELRQAYERGNKLTYENDDLMRENELLKSRDKTREETILSQLKLIESHQDTIILLNKTLSTLTTPIMVDNENNN